MAQIADNKKFISLEGVRVSYRPKDDSIQITSTDEDLAGENFHLLLNKNSEAEKVLRSLLVERGIIKDNKRAEESQSLPTTTIFHNHQKDSYEHNQFPLGVTAQGVFVWDVRDAAHMYVSGYTGAGKSVILESIYEHCRKNDWMIYGIDFKQVELSSFKNAHQTFKQIAQNKEQLFTLLDELTNITQQRLSRMSRTKSGSFEANKNEPHIMLIVDEAWVLEQGDIFTPEELIQIHGQFSQLLRLGRAAGLHIAAGSQHPGQYLTHFDARIVMGRVNQESSTIMLNTLLAATLPTVKGRGLAKIRHKLVEFQAALPSR